MQFYESILPNISKANFTVGTFPEYRLWSERLLARHCMLSARHVSTNAQTPRKLLAKGSFIEPACILKPYRVWADIWDLNHSRSLGQQSNVNVEHGSSRTRIWKEYYEILSFLIQHRILEPVFESRLQHVQELKKVEDVHESNLLKETSFPKADQASFEIDHWTDQVMANWRAMLGAAWNEEDLGSGGRIALTRGVSDVSHHPHLWSALTLSRSP